MINSKYLNILKEKVEKVAIFEYDMNTFEQFFTTISSNRYNFTVEMFVYPCGVCLRMKNLRQI